MKELTALDFLRCGIRRSLNTDYIPNSVTIPIRATALATLNLFFSFSIRLLTAGSEIHKESAISLAVLPDFNSRKVAIS